MVLCRAGNHPRAPEDRFEIGRSWLCAGRTFGQRGPACATSLWCGEEAGRAKYCQWDLSIDCAENSMSFARLVDYVGHRHWKTNGYMMINVYKCIWSFCFSPQSTSFIVIWVEVKSGIVPNKWDCGKLKRPRFLARPMHIDRIVSDLSDLSKISDLSTQSIWSI